ncbi:site-specific integrase [Alistipes sp. cv1]|uniref:site-specific integrase n=1 Tax=Alistipes sp. cv1 TaxID=1622071 RepID=UPI000C77C8C6|nr:site-specific integrase [Alistipes sp. cv1]
MYNYSKDGITVSSILDDRKENKNGSYPVKIRVTFKRVRKYYSTGKMLSVDDWGRLPNTRSHELGEIRKDIENSFSLVKANVIALAEKGEFTFDALNVRLSRNAGDTINAAFQVKIDSLLKEERIGTMLYYDNILKNVEKFGGKQIPFDYITVDWLRRFEKFLLKDKNHTTVGMHMRAIRAMMNLARKSGAIKESQYPFGKDRYEIKTGEGRKKALTLEQIAQILKYEDGKDTERYRDIWFFMYLCNGINTADLVRLKYKNIVDGEICYVRQKTANTTNTIKEIKAIITPEMQRIMDRWGNPPSPDSLIFPLIKPTDDPLIHKKRTKDLTKRINEHMKVIGEKFGIDGISTYTARHSYATVLKRSGANIAYISESLGHNSLKTTESYLASFEKEERQKNAALLTNFGNK